MESYVLFDCCKVISGYSRSMILDVQRKSFYFIPNDLIQYINSDGVIREQDESRELIQFLLGEELIFKCDDSILPQFINAKSSTWDYPAHLSNAIVTCMALDEEYLSGVVHQLTETLQCRYIEFRFIHPMSMEEINAATAFINNLNVLGFSLCFCLKDIRQDREQLANTLIACNRLFKTIVFNYPKDEAIDAGRGNYGNIFFTGVSNLELSCGIVSDALFTIDGSHYYESLAHNTCLNRKIAIDAEGNIKNCPSMTKTYGNVMDTKLIDVVNSPDFRKLWNIRKDDIYKCKDCEFRHICTDCRAFTDNPDDLYSAPLKCGYDPYTTEWQEWSTLPFKQKAIVMYGMTDSTNLKNVSV